MSGQHPARHRGLGRVSRAALLYWELLDNRSGNSNAAQRIALLDVCLTLLGRARIGLVVGDREFVGHVWLKWLKDNGLNFVMRLPKHHLLTDVQGHRQAITDWGLAQGQVRRLAQRQVDGVWGQVWVKALAGGEFLFLFGTPGLQQLGQLYAKRWTIEQCFQNLKGRGFHLESSHLACHLKLRKLLALVSLAYAFCLSVGQAADRQQPVGRKKHGYRATSLSRHGLDIVRQLTRPDTDARTRLARMVEAIIDWLIKQVPVRQTTVKIKNHRVEYLLRHRFGTAYEFSTELLPDLDVARLLVVPGTVQLLVENAIKHNAGDEDAPLRISIRATATTLTVTHPRRPKRTAIDSLGTGLAV